MTGGLLPLLAIAAFASCSMTVSALFTISSRAERDRALSGWSAIASGCVTAAFALMYDWLPAAVTAVLAIACAWLWWSGRRKDRKRAGSLIGDKSRAVRAALVRTMREAAKPRPALRPAPGGAR